MSVTCSETTSALASAQRFLMPSNILISPSVVKIERFVFNRPVERAGISNGLRELRNGPAFGVAKFRLADVVVFKRLIHRNISASILHPRAECKCRPHEHLR